MASFPKRIIPYNCDPLFERIFVTLACSSRSFYSRIGHAIDAELLKNEQAKLAIAAAHQINADAGHGPPSPLIVIQRLRRWMGDGKLTLEAVKEVAEFFDDIEDAGLLDEESVIAELAPLIQARIRDDAVTAAIESYSKHGDLSKVIALENKAQRIGKVPVPSATALQLVPLDTVAFEPLEWLWEQRIPLGKITMLDGDPGLGKSTLLADLAARISAGLPMPGTTHTAPAADVVLLSAEDGAADTIRPRIEVAGGDARRVHVVANGQIPTLPAALAVVEEWLKEYRPRLLVIDPLMAFLVAAVDSHRDQDMRTVTTPLAALAQRYRVAIILVRHLNKAAGSRALQRGGGSMGLIGAARAGLLVAADPANPSHRVLVGTKSNLAPPARAFRFKLVSDVATAEDRPFEAGRIEWLDEFDVTADDLLAPPANRETAVAGAREFLERVLKDGPLEALEVERLAATEGISQRTLERARKGLVHPERVSGRWILSLAVPQDRQSREAQDTGGLGGLRTTPA